MQAKEKHPADELANALARAEGIVTLLSGCYDQESCSFATGNSFVHESVLAIQSILEQANQALTRIYQTCDLSFTIPTPGETNMVIPLSGKVANDDYLNQFGPEAETAAAPEYPVQSSLRQSVSDDRDLMDRPAQTYEELLQKLNVVSDMAVTTRENISPAESILLAVEDLYLDLAKLRGAG